VYVEFALALAWQKEAPGTDIVRNRPVATG
jgi:hypothetical protein